MDKKYSFIHLLPENELLGGDHAEGDVEIEHNLGDWLDLARQGLEKLDEGGPLVVLHDVGGQPSGVG